MVVMISSSCSRIVRATSRGGHDGHVAAVDRLVFPSEPSSRSAHEHLPQPRPVRFISPAGRSVHHVTRHSLSPQAHALPRSLTYDLTQGQPRCSIPQVVVRVSSIGAARLVLIHALHERVCSSRTPQGLHLPQSRHRAFKTSHLRSLMLREPLRELLFQVSSHIHPIRVFSKILQFIRIGRQVIHPQTSGVSRPRTLSSACPHELRWPHAPTLAQ